ncbi:hypothetical protein E4U58_005469, partial [Claviceps cyperi]
MILDCRFFGEVPTAVSGDRHARLRQFYGAFTNAATSSPESSAASIARLRETTSTWSLYSYIEFDPGTQGIAMLSLLQVVITSEFSPGPVAEAEGAWTLLLRITGMVAETMTHLAAARKKRR